MKIKKNEEVLLVSEQGHRYFAKAEDKTLHLSDGALDLSKLTNYGKAIKTHNGKKYVVLKPSFLDKLHQLKRGPQVILPKDAVAVVAHTGLAPGARIVDAGTGSGWLTAFLAHIIGPSGKITSYEKRQDFHGISKENIKTLGLTNVQLKHADITKGIKERNLDLITLDLLTPTKVPNISQALKLGAYCVAYVPHLIQAREFADFADKQGMIIEKVLEAREKQFSYQDNSLKHSKKMPHTGFLVFARKATA